MRVLIGVLMAAAAIHAADGDTPQAAVRATYDAISGPAGVRDWARFQSLFAEGARLISMRVTADGATPTVMSPEEYAKRAGPNFEKNPFYENEIASKTEAFGTITHIFSTYESHRAIGDKPFARGINSFQLVKVGNQWKVMTILWDAERPGNPIPEKYLPPGGGSKVAE